MTSSILRVVSLGLLLLTASARADLVIPGADGSDGALNITTNTVIDLSQAVTAAWDANNAASAGKGVYDSNKWAVVFKYTNVTIATNATVTFKNHASRAPVVWLVSGDVTISGMLSLSGSSYAAAPRIAEPGPGGFRGGVGVISGVASGAGFGPGGAQRIGQENQADFVGTSEYGNPSAVPLLGGSGGSGDVNQGLGGGAGGGAILIACRSRLSVMATGSIHANGGSGFRNDGTGERSGGGSGGSIRLIADVLEGAGNIRAVGAGGWILGGPGRVRIERAINQNTIVVLPEPSVVNLATGATALLWPPAEAPEVRIVSIQGKDVPGDPRAEFGTIGADITLPRTGAVLVEVESRNVERASVMKIRGTPRMNGNYREVDGIVDAVLSENPLVIRWKAELPVQDGYAAVQVKVVRP